MKNFFKRSRRRSQVSGAKVKSREALRVQVMGSALVLGVVVFGFLWWIGSKADDEGRPLTRSEVQALEQQVAALTEERNRLQSIANAAESQINMEKATQRQLAEQARRLTEENIRLKEDLAFFEKLLPSNKGRGISIRRLRAELIAPNQIRYRVLIMQGGKNPSTFVGELQLAVMLLSEGEEANVMIIFPQENAADSQGFALKFRQYQRLEGVLTLPEGVQATAVQARIMEKGQIRAQEMVNL